MCLTPYIKNRDYRTLAEPTQNATLVLPCGKCGACLRKRKNNWVFRLKQETKRSSTSCFITLTYAEIPLSKNGFPTLIKKDLQQFNRALRDAIRWDTSITLKSKLKYYAVGEYGTKSGRPHYHTIHFNLPEKYINNPQLIQNIWNKGHVMVAPSNGKTIQYVAKYVMKGNHLTPEAVCEDTGLIYDAQPQFSNMSKELGLNYLTPQTVKYHIDTLSTLVNVGSGQKMSLPKYYRDKIFSRSELRIIYETIQASAEADFEKYFKNDYNKYETWKTNELRKDKQQAKTERAVI